MPPLRPFENLDAGGVDSRSNPLNMPRNRALRCLNWAPKAAGFWELRYGYSTVTMTTVSASAIHSIFPYRTWNGNKYVLFMQGTSLKTLDTSTGTVTTPTVRGTAIASSAKGGGYFANNRFHYGNGTDQKWFDGTNWRDSGLPGLTAAQIANIVIVEGVRELTTTQAAAVTLAAAATGTFPADTQTGRAIYVAIWDTVNNEAGPATIPASGARVVVGLNEKITVANMPDLSAVNANWVKLIAGTIDGGNLAWFFTNTVTNITGAVYASLHISITAVGHGLSAGDVVVINGTSPDAPFDSVYTVTSIVSADVFKIGTSNAISNVPQTGTVKRIVMAPNATTSIDVTAPTQDMQYQVNQDRGLAASTVGGPLAGYQFTVSIYNPTGGGHVGNCVSIGVGGRALQTAYRTNWRISGLPNLVAIDTEWTMLMGRTGDGATVAYPLVDNDGNLIYTNQSFFSMSSAAIGVQPMPLRNGIIPSQCNMFTLAGDFCYAADTGSPYLRRSADLSQAVERQNVILGRPEQSWAPNDLDTFPTGEALTGIFEIDQEVFCGTLHDSALSVNLAGIQQWVGPWQVGIAGMRAGTKCGAYGFFWITGDKQLATFSQGVPVIASEEYELAELSQIGDAYLSTVECVYYRNAAQNKDELRIEARQTDGTPYTIIHDFKLRDGSPPVSPFGQGYASQFVGPLATAFTSASIRDSNGRLQVYSGASNGRLFNLYSGANDAGTEYTADLIALLNGGPERINVPYLDYFGDGNIKITVGRNLSASIAAGAQWGFEPPNTDANVSEAVPGSEQDSQFRVFLVPPEVQKIYVRFQLTSHSADGNLNLNSPIHVPLETYGKLYEVVPELGDGRDN